MSLSFTAAVALIALHLPHPNSTHGVSVDIGLLPATIFEDPPWLRLLAKKTKPKK